jgi:hypothetical protein
MVQLVRPAGLEPEGTNEITGDSKGSLTRSITGSTADFQLIVRVIEAWPGLPYPLKAAILAIIESSSSSQEDSR